MNKISNKNMSEFNFCYPDYIFPNENELIEFRCPINHGILRNPVTDECP